MTIVGCLRDSVKYLNDYYFIIICYILMYMLYIIRQLFK